MARMMPLMVRRGLAAAAISHWPRRDVVIGLTFLGSIIAYTDRVNISVAAVAMREHFGWSQTEKGLVLSAFFVGYLSFMFIAGLLSARYGGKRVLGYSVLAWSIVTLLTPGAAMISIAALIAARIGMGVGEAAMFPAAYELFGRWVPEGERSRAVGRVLSGTAIGMIIGLTASGWLVGRYGWPMAFYAFGACGLVWAILWDRSVENDPADDPRLSAEERALLMRARPAKDSAKRMPVRRLLFQRPVAAIVVAHFATTWTLYVLLSWLPSYFRDVHGLTIANAGLFSAAPWLAHFAGANFAATLSDHMIRRGMRATTTRKLMQWIGLLGSASFLVAVRDAASPAAALSLLCAAAAALACSYSGYAAGVLDIAPHRGAVVFGFSNSFAAIPGILGVAATGWLVDWTGTYSAAFAVTAAISLAGALTFGFLFDARIVAD